MDNKSDKVLLAIVIILIIYCCVNGCPLKCNTKRSWDEGLSEYEKLKIDTEATNEYVKRKRGY